VSEEWQPAFPGQRPPFERGNTLSLKHGARSPRLVGRRAGEIAERLAALVPGYDDSHAPTVELLARELARIELADEWLDEHGIIDAEGQPAGILKMRSVWTNSAARLASDLGLNPMQQARLGLVRARTGDEARRRLDEYVQEKYGRGEEPTED
jgi:hypothetical protein